MIDQFFSGRNLFILFAILSANFIQPLFPCNTTKHMAESRFLRYFLGFITLVFFVVVTDTAYIDKYIPLGTIITTSVVIFIWFILASKMTANWWYLLVLLFGGIYLINLYEDRHLHNKDTADMFATMKQWFLGLSVILTCVGTLIYIGEKKVKYRSKFNYGDLFFALPSCKGSTPQIDYMVALKTAFLDVGNGSGGSSGSQKGGGEYDPFETVSNGSVSMTGGAYLDAISNNLT